ncbi:hypothetical protein MTR_4g022530 [Medicago truncatula]|uniref:Uncharacterized protein n=1 Tax=Medicago truncatula TaxID=3880 RepID=G7JUK9_MEDTR|nr:hypothetical protein MTR_4g022530 [Medicago truncatula]
MGFFIDCDASSSCSKTEYAYAGILDDKNQKLYPSNFFHLLSVHPIGFNNQQQQTGGYNTSNNEDLRKEF